MKALWGFSVWFAVVPLVFLGCTNANPVLAPFEGLRGLAELGTSSSDLAFFSPEENSSLVTSNVLITGSCRKGSLVTIGGSGLGGGSIVLPCSSSNTFSQDIVLTPGYGSRTIEIAQTDDDGNTTTVTRNFNVADLIAPTAPTGLSDSDWSQSTTVSPPLIFVGGTDDGSGVDHHEVKIQDHTNGDTDLTSFAPIASGGTVSGLVLANATTYRFVVRTVDGAGNKSAEVTSDGWTVDILAPTLPGTIVLGSLGDDFKSKTPIWTFPESTDVGGSGLAGYKIEIRKKAGDSIVTNFESGVGNGSIGFFLAKGNDFLVGGETYYAKVKAVDLAGNEGAEAQTPDWVALKCPANFISVPARAPYTSLGFCVAQYEMKIQGESNGVQDFQASFTAESRASGTPWVRVKREQAINKCQELGPGYDLISNDQWQSIAQDLELQSLNWTSGSVGSGMMYRGHSDDSPSELLSVSTADPYDQTGNNVLAAEGSGKEQRRRLTLSNGNAIWDLAGNANEWVKDDNANKYGNDHYISQITDVSNPIVIAGRTARVRFGPALDHTTLGGSQYGGLGKGLINDNQGAIVRGASYRRTTYAGVFFVDLGTSSTFWSNFRGFRCTLVP
jgi:hypothetical protein